MSVSTGSTSPQFNTNTSTSKSGEVSKPNMSHVDIANHHPTDNPNIENVSAEHIHPEQLDNIHKNPHHITDHPPTDHADSEFAAKNILHKEPDESEQELNDLLAEIEMTSAENPSKTGELYAKIDQLKGRDQESDRELDKISNVIVEKEGRLSDADVESISKKVQIIEAKLERTKNMEPANQEPPAKVAYPGNLGLKRLVPELTEERELKNLHNEAVALARSPATAANTKKLENLETQGKQKIDAFVAKITSEDSQKSSGTKAPTVEINRLSHELSSLGKLVEKHPEYKDASQKLSNQFSSNKTLTNNDVKNISAAVRMIESGIKHKEIIETPRSPQPSQLTFSEISSPSRSMTQNPIRKTTTETKGSQAKTEVGAAVKQAKALPTPPSKKTEGTTTTASKSKPLPNLEAKKAERAQRQEEFKRLEGLKAQSKPPKTDDFISKITSNEAENAKGTEATKSEQERIILEVEALKGLGSEFKEDVGKLAEYCVIKSNLTTDDVNNISQAVQMIKDNAIKDKAIESDYQKRLEEKQKDYSGKPEEVALFSALRHTSEDLKEDELKRFIGRHSDEINQLLSNQSRLNPILLESFVTICYANGHKFNDRHIEKLEGRASKKREASTNAPRQPQEGIKGSPNTQGAVQSQQTQSTEQAKPEQPEVQQPDFLRKAEFVCNKVTKMDLNAQKVSLTGEKTKTSFTDRLKSRVTDEPSDAEVLKYARNTLDSGIVSGNVYMASKKRELALETDDTKRTEIEKELETMEKNIKKFEFQLLRLNQSDWAKNTKTLPFLDEKAVRRAEKKLGV